MLKEEVLMWRFVLFGFRTIVSNVILPQMESSINCWSTDLIFSSVPCYSVQDETRTELRLEKSWISSYENSIARLFLSFEEISSFFITWLCNLQSDIVRPLICSSLLWFLKFGLETLCQFRRRFYFFSFCIIQRLFFKNRHALWYTKKRIY